MRAWPRCLEQETNTGRDICFALANVASMQTRPTRANRPAVHLRRLVGGFLQMPPDVAIVGEVHDPEALPLLSTAVARK